MTFLRRRKPLRRGGRIRPLRFQRRPTKASDSPELRFGKGESRAEQATGKRAIWNAVVKAIRALVMVRDQHRCRACGQHERDVTLCMHEIVPRSALRGRPASEIFTLSNCLMLCLACHKRAHGAKVEGAEFDLNGTDANTPGGVTFAWRRAA